MKLTVDMLDEKVSDYEECFNNFITYADYIRLLEGELGIEPANIRNMNDEELDKYDNFLFELSLNKNFKEKWENKQLNVKKTFLR